MVDFDRGAVPGRTKGETLMSGTKWNARRVHRWFAVVVGLAFSIWVGSGMVMSLGIVPTAKGNRIDRPGPSTDLTGAVISPSQAVARTGADPGVGGAPSVRGIRLGVVGTRRVYVVEVADEGSVLVDIETGEIVRIDMPLARELASGWMQPDREIAEERIVDSYDLWYVRGSLPVFRFVFDNGTRAHVQTDTGEVTLADRSFQVYHGITGLHDFTILTSVLRIGNTRWLLWTASLGAIVVIFTGYFIAYPTLPFLRRSRSKA